MVTDDPIGVGGGSTSFRVGCVNLSTQVVVQSSEKTFSKIHIADRVDAICEFETAARHLTVAVSPVVLDTFHVPLVDKDDNFISLSSIDLTEKFFILLVNHNFLGLGEENVTALDEPVHVVSIKALFGESSGADHMDLLTITCLLINPS